MVNVAGDCGGRAWDAACARGARAACAEVMARAAAQAVTVAERHPVMLLSFRGLPARADDLWVDYSLNDPSWQAACGGRLSTSALRWCDRRPGSVRGSRTRVEKLCANGYDFTTFIIMCPSTDTWDLQLVGQVRGSPMSYALDGKQYVAIATGYAVFAFGL